MAAPFRFRCDSLAEDACRVLAFTMDERLGAPYALSVVVDCDDDALVSSEHLGEPGTLFLHDHPWWGIIHENDLLFAEGARRIHRLTLRPPLSALELSCHSRVFVDKTIPEIIEQILKDNAIRDYELRLTGDYPARKHVSQYKESDLDFVHRWMEREGIYYYFLHQDDAAKLVITDDKGNHDALEAGSIRFVSARDDWRLGDHLRSWRRAHQAAVENIALGDYDYMKPALTLGAPRASGAIGFESLVRFEDNLQDDADAKHAAKIAAEREAAAQLRFHGLGRAHAMHAGASFTLEEHPRDGFNQSYYATRVVHRGSQLQDDPEFAQYLEIEPMSDVYQIEVEALVGDVQFRPLRQTAWPRVSGLEHAVVDADADSPYAPIDAEGRYRVLMLFDEAGSPAGKASALLRMLQPHGGSPEGFHFPLRKGTEVLVTFVHGDPDRPYIVGAVPNPTTPSPVTSKNHTQNVLQTGSKNRVEIEDDDGKQYIDISTPPQNTFVHLGVHAGLGDHNIVVSTDGDGLHHAGGNRDLTIGGDQTEEVTGNVTEEYKSDQTTHVFGSFTETIDAGETQTISAGSTQTIDGGLVQTIDGGETRTVDGDLAESISGSRTQTIDGDTTETINGSLDQTVAGGITITTPSTYSLTAPPSVTMMTPAAATINGLGGVTIIAPGGQLTVDYNFFKIGERHTINYLIKVTTGVLRIGLTAFWLRRLGIHSANYGLKIDIKKIDDKNVKEKKVVGMELVTAAGKIMKKVISMFG